MFSQLRELGVHPGNVLRTTTPGAQGKSFKTTKKAQNSPIFTQKRSERLPKNIIGNFDPFYAADMAFLGLSGRKMGQNASAHAGSVGPYVHTLPRLRERFAHIPDQY
jgi:hypothetical protein